MTHAMRMELANAIRGRYAASAHKAKRRILKEFVAATGHHEKSAIRVLNILTAPKRSADAPAQRLSSNKQVANLSDKSHN